MLKTIPNIEGYPKTVLLGDASLVKIRPLTHEDKTRLLKFFMRIPEGDRYYLRDNVTSPAAVKEWTEHLQHDRVIPIVALAGDAIVADATLHRTVAPAVVHVAEIRMVVDPDYREVGLGRRLLREMLSIARNLGISTATMQLVDGGERSAMIEAESVGFQRVATLSGRVKDARGNYRNLVLVEFDLEDLETRGI